VEAASVGGRSSGSVCRACGRTTAQRPWNDRWSRPRPSDRPGSGCDEVDGSGTFQRRVWKQHLLDARIGGVTLNGQVGYESRLEVKVRGVRGERANADLSPVGEAVPILGDWIPGWPSI
jgi:hypothetical protein